MQLISSGGRAGRPSSIAASRPTLSLVAGLAALVSIGCGVSYGQKVQSTTLSPYGGDFNIEGDPAYEGSTRFTTRGHSLTLYDTSGLLLAVAASAGSAVTAQREAEQAAVERGAKVGDRYSYEYQVYMPVPNKLTTLSYSWGETTGVDNSRADGAMAVGSYSELDLTTRPKTWFLGADQLTLQLSASWQTWSAAGIPGALFPAEGDYIGMPVGLSYGHLLFPRVQVEGRATWDPLSLFSYLRGPHHANFTAGLHASAVLTSWLHVEADASYQRLPVDFGTRDAREWTANVNLVLWWKGPAFWRASH